MQALKITDFGDLGTPGSMGTLLSVFDGVYRAVTFDEWGGPSLIVLPPGMAGDVIMENYRNKLPA